MVRSVARLSVLSRGCPGPDLLCTYCLSSPGPGGNSGDTGESAPEPFSGSQPLWLHKDLLWGWGLSHVLQKDPAIFIMLHSNTSSIRAQRCRRIKEPAFWGASCPGEDLNRYQRAHSPWTIQEGFPSGAVYKMWARALPWGQEPRGYHPPLTPTGGEKEAVLKT